MGYFRLSPEERERRKQLDLSPAMRQAVWYIAWALFFAISPWVLSLLAFSPGFTGWLWQSGAGTGSPAHGLLTGYLRWYWVVLLVWGGATAGSVVMAVLLPLRAAWNCLILRRIADGPPSSTDADQVNAVGYSTASALLLAAAGLPIMMAVLGCTILSGENMASLPFQARRDLAQIESGTLEQAEVWIHPNYRPARLPGPAGSGQLELVTCYWVLDADTGGQWQPIYVPNTLGFSPKSPFEEDQTIAWNWEHAQRYRVYMTSEFHLVETILPVP